MHSLKTKLVLAISVFVIFLFSIAALLLIDEKQKELSRDLYTKARATTELTASRITELYESLLAEKSFVLFNREMKDMFRKNDDVVAISITNFSGDILYNSRQEQHKAYEGAARKINDPDLLARVRSNWPSYLLRGNRIVYLKKDADGNYAAVNENEKETAEITEKDEIQNIVFPVNGKFAVVYDISYEHLYNRVVGTTERIVLLLVFGVLLGLGLGWYFATRITTPIEKLTIGALVLAKGDFTARVKVETKDEVGVLAETFNQMAHDLELSTQAKIEKERLSKELEVAARIQKQILPSVLPVIPGLDLAAMVIPATEIGGDCYDFIKVDPDTNIFYISDVTGHGIPSGIVVSIANAIIYSYAGSSSLSQILVSANKVLKEKTAQNMFMTLLMLQYKKGVLSYVSAGHPEMLHYVAQGKKVVAEKGGGIALGMVPDISHMVAESSVSFAKGDCIILYSDGVPEAANMHGEQYGMQRFKRALSDHGELASAEAIKNALLADVKQFMGGSAQLDDITVVVIRHT